LDQSLQRATRLVLATLERICRIFNVYDLYRRSFSAIRRIVGSLTPTIDANFCNNCPGSSEISAWVLSTTARVLAGVAESSLDFSDSLYFAMTSYTVDLGYPKNRMISVAERPARTLSIIAALRLCFALDFNIATVSRL